MSSGPSSEPVPKRQKRAQVKTACQLCRAQKIKCDSQRPCRECVRRQVECVYHAREDETIHQAKRRQLNEVSESYQLLNGVFEFLRRQEEPQARSLLSRIRSGESVWKLASDVHHGIVFRSDTQQTLVTSHERPVRERLVMTLTQSTAPMSDIAAFSSSFLSVTTRFSLPNVAAFKPVRDRIITLESIAGLLSNEIDENGSMIAASSTEFDSPPGDGSYNGPLHWAPVSYWTDLVEESQNEAASHIISIFLTLINPFWRLVEEDLFMKAIRQPASTHYCSPLLVHAILALASLWSEVDVAFVPPAPGTTDSPGQWLTRGEHFHNAAIVLWKAEGEKSSLANTQALLCLSMSSSFRGKDRLGFHFAQSAAKLNREMDNSELEISSKLTGRALTDYFRARRCISCTALWMDVTYTLGIAHDYEELISTKTDLADLADILPSKIVYVGYPQRDRPTALNPNLLMRHRCSLTRHNLDVLRTLSLKDRDGTTGKQHVWSSAQDLLGQIKAWHEKLPNELSYKPNMSSSLFEFHGQCYCALMTTSNIAVEAFTTYNSTETGMTTEDFESTKLQLQNNALDMALSGANIIRDYRETYGFRYLGPILMQTAAQSIFTFLPYMKPNDRQMQKRPAEFIKQIQDGFSECFRCLLAVGMGMMLPRGIVRMTYRTAQIMEADIPDDVEQMLSLVAETAWQPSDLHQLNSCYPNWALASQEKAKAIDFQMEDILRKWEELEVGDKTLSGETGSESVIGTAPAGSKPQHIEEH